jgi:arylsulfatase
VEKGTAHLVDIAPTFYDIAGAQYPASYKGVKTNALPGVSLSSLLYNNKPLDSTRSLFWERAGNRVVRKGKWKLVSIYPSYQWELYNLENDRGETQNLASQNALIVDRLSAEYFKWARQNDVVDYDNIKPKQPLLPVTRRE